MKTAVLEVNTGGAITNIKEFKAYLDELKGTLLGLEKGTDDYKKVASELREGQQKLNEVMDVAKGRGDALEGSYDNLTTTMARLKREWKATNDEAERASLGKQINAINDQLKAFDASIGNYQRNVGNYAGAFEEAFKNIAQRVGSNGTIIGVLASNIKGLIPFIKQVNTTAISGLNGIKKAIAATGIGLLVVALGEVIAHLDDITGALGRIFTKEVSIEAEAKRCNEQFEAWQKEIDKIDENNRLEKLRMELEGISQVDIAQTVLENAKDALNAEANVVAALLKDMRGAARKLNDEYRNLNEGTLKELGFSQEQINLLTQDFNKTLGDIGYSQEEIEQHQQNFIFYIQQTDKEQSKLVKNDAFKKMAENLKLALTNLEKYLSQVKSLGTSEKEAEIREADRAKKIAERAQEAFMSTSQLITKTYKKERELLVKQFGEGSKEVAALTAEYHKKLRDIAETSKLSDVIFTTSNKEFDKIKSELDKFYVDLKKETKLVATENYNTNMEALRKQLDEGEISFETYLKSVNELNIKYVEESSGERLRINQEVLRMEYEQRKEYLTKGESDEIAQIDKTANKRLDELKKLLRDGKISQAEYNKQIEALEKQASGEKEKIHKRYDDTRLRLDQMYTQQNQQLEVTSAAETAEKKLKAIEGVYKGKKVSLELGFDMEEFNLNQMFDKKKTNPFSTADIDAYFDLTTRRIEELHTNTQGMLSEQAAALQEQISQLPEGSEERLELEQQLANTQVQIEQDKVARLQEIGAANEDYQDQLTERQAERVEYLKQVVGGIGDLMGNYASFQEEMIKEDIANGKITEEEGKKQYERVKKLQIAQAVINTLSGAIGAYMEAVKTYPAPWGPILGGITAASVTAAGAAQIKKIKSSSLSSSSVSSPGAANLSSVVNEYTPTYTQNVTSQTEVSELANALRSTPIYVSVTDIDSTQNMVKTREQETSW